MNKCFNSLMNKIPADLVQRVLFILYVWQNSGYKRPCAFWPEPLSDFHFSLHSPACSARYNIFRGGAVDFSFVLPVVAPSQRDINAPDQACQGFKGGDFLAVSDRQENTTRPLTCAEPGVLASDFVLPPRSGGSGIQKADNTPVYIISQKNIRLFFFVRIRYNTYPWGKQAKFAIHIFNNQVGAWQRLSVCASQAPGARSTITGFMPTS